MANLLFPDDPVNYFETQLRERLNEFNDPRDTWMYGINTHLFLNNHQSRAFAHYVLREYEAAESILRELRMVDWETYFTNYWARQAHMPNRLRRGSISYYQARIYAILDMKQEAVDALKRSIQEGKMFEFRSFDQDWDLAGLRDYGPYRDLLDHN